ncbi:hypothetical protein B0H63DRAFT_516597 [Podospora didyma]|uniref:NAD(P)-binding domain-containing protein n=1 Tax=Podospora didyma TaxID=330526 RepID=A0AAE0P4Y2_9PEZI|nr:hypothetical protein B0H63DRAFT_516597 [Podospora didyma]
MRVLVIDASGCLGRACITALQATSPAHTIIALVHTPATFPAALANLCDAIVTVGARDTAKLADALRTHECDALVQAGGYTAIWPWQTSYLPVMFAAALDAAEGVARERSGITRDGEIPTVDKRIRAWMVCDLGGMDAPWGHLPPVFPIHRVRYAMLIQRPTSAVAWSAMCPAMMLSSASHRGARAL